jgi:Flp pilus assembly protein TadD
MARSRIKQKKTRTVTESNGASASTKPTEPSVEDLLAKARSLVTQCDYELAEKFVQRILQQRPNHADGKELLGVIQLETGDLDEAKEVCVCDAGFNRTN